MELILHFAYAVAAVAGVVLFVYLIFKLTIAMYYIIDYFDGDKRDKIYHLMLTYFPTRIMYKYVYIDSQHKILMPRWGWSKRQIKEAEKKAKKWDDNITFI